MKREGRQHGMVQTYPIIQSPWNSKRIIKFESSAGPFTRVSQKPTNHSKFTGKCARPRCASCHIQPAGKSKDKTKGTQKLKSCDVSTNYKLLSWRVVGSRRGLNFKGGSATDILDHLANDYVDDEDEDEIDDSSYDDAYGVYQYGGSGSYSYGCGLPPHHHRDWEADSAIASTTVAIQELDEVDDDYKRADGDGDGDGDGSGDDDERMSFCDVGFIWEQVEALEGDVDGWCLVEEI